MRWILPGVAALLVHLGAARAAEPIDYLRQVKPLLTARCYACHASLQQKAELRVDTVRAMREGGNNGPVVVPGNGKESLLIERLRRGRGKGGMPPPSEGEEVPEKDIALLQAWIDQGANGPADEKPEPDPREHWSFRAPVRPAVPRPGGSLALPAGPTPANPIDAFLAVEWQKQGLKPQPAADRRLLLRRLHLDLVGLPPTREELAAFEADTSPDAYRKVVDRLLASPQYGERWGRHWMDVWRYSDWWGLGAEVRNSQKHIWHWRDWIIESLNADKGYDQMVREMLAADELYPDDLDRLRATGFLGRSYFKFNRTTWLDECVEHTGKAFLGLTLNCAKCHDHKYDPIASVDYYRMRAFFEPYQLRTDMVAGQPDFEKDGIPRAFDCNLDVPTFRFERGDESRPRKDRPLQPGVPPLLSFGPLEIKPVTLPPEAHHPGLRPFVLEGQLKLAEQRIATARAAVEAARKVLAEAEKTAPQTVASPEPKPVPSPQQPADPGKVLLQDDFKGPKPELWEAGPGMWRHAGGKLLQEKGNEERSVLKAKVAPPPDFEARFRLAITGGEPWRSVGVCFDVAGDGEVLAYVSAYAGGPKVQLAYKQGGSYLYPAEATQPRPIELNKPLELALRVRGPLVNVAVDGKPAVAYRLPVARRKGALQLVTYAAKAEFLAFELRELPPGLVLHEAGATPAQAAQQPWTVDQARASLGAAEKALAAAELQPALLRARAAADRARFQSPPVATSGPLVGSEGRTSGPLVVTAARLEKQAAVATAEENLARAEVELLRAAAKPAAEQKRNAARAALEQARKAAENPGEAYTSLRGALKTPENNLEGEASLNKPFPLTSTGRRTALARWIADPRNPLTARVAVNHVWLRHFGKPLVPNVFEFGRKGLPPTHPALLDYLAVELMENGWSFKRLHRLIVTSEAYCRSSSAAGAPAVNLERDRENRWYWRMNPVRLEAQAVRDSLLFLGGDLDPTIGGPPVDARDETSRRRSLYFVHSHNEHHKFLALFDDASVLECYRRSESIIPQQALALSNSRLALTAAEKINARLHAQLPGVGDADFVRAAFETVLAGKPTAEEQAACEQALAEIKQGLNARKVPEADRRARGGLIQALLNHNDFVTIR